MKLVSIVVPCYHAEKHIQQCIDTIKNQTYTNWEAIFVIDDVDYDDTIRYVREFMDLNTDKRIGIFSRRDKSSPAIARNKGYEKCLGDYICFLDVDDTWEPEKLAFQSYIIDNYDVLFTSGIWHRSFGDFKLSPTPDVFEDHFNNNLFIWSSVMFKKSALEQVFRDRGYIFDSSLPQCDDGDLLIYMKKNGYSFGAVVSSPLTHIYEHGGNLTQGNLWKPNYYAAKNWYRYGYYFNWTKHLIFGIVAVVSNKLGLYTYLRKRRMEAHT